MDNKGVIYVLTNPAFPEYIKIGYADNLEKRLAQLNKSECLPFAFRAYCVYEVGERLRDKELHNMIDTLNPDLRAMDNFDGKSRIREFYAMSPEDGYRILESIANISGTRKNLKRVKPEGHELIDEEVATQNRINSTIVYAEDYHYDHSSERIINLYLLLKERILQLENVNVEPKKVYIAFKVNNVNFCDVVLQNSKLQLYINLPYGDLEDSKGIIKDCTNLGHYGNGDNLIEISDDTEIDYIANLVKESYEKAIIK